MAPFFFPLAKVRKLFKSTHLLIGKWKVENKNTYEVWQKEKDALVGRSYKLENGKEQVLETLRIKKTTEGAIYEATVPNQNQGQTIPFTLSKKHQAILSFENPAHDFPKKIQYKMIHEDKLEVKVLGENGQGFSYFLTRQ